MRVSPHLERWLTGSGSDPSVRFRYWTEVDGRALEDARVRRARAEIGQVGWAARFLSWQGRDGHWATPGTSDREIVRPRFASTYWIALILADFGMSRTDPRIRRTAELLLRWRSRVLRADDGELCFAGNATRALLRFGYRDHPVVQRSIDWILRAQKEDGGWNCFPSRRGTLDGWEGLAALAEIPVEQRSDAVRRAIERGAEFYLKRHLLVEGAGRYDPWRRIHYPNHFFYDGLVGLRLLTRLGYGGDPRLGPAVRWLVDRRRGDGRWILDATQPDWDLREAARYPFPGPELPIVIELPGVPSRWATVEALSVLARRSQS